MQTEKITYAQLERLLNNIGYRQVPSPPDARVFAYPEYDAVSVLPCADETEWARPHHLITLRKVAVERGIVDDKTFEKLLNEVRQESTGLLAKAS
jgi:hypothetical protein